MTQLKRLCFSSAHLSINPNPFPTSQLRVRLPILTNTQIKVKVIHNPLQTRLLNPPLIRHIQITPQRKPMLHTREQLQMIRLLRLPKDTHSLVPRFGGERVVGLRA